MLRVTPFRVAKTPTLITPVKVHFGGLLTSMSSSTILEWPPGPLPLIPSTSTEVLGLMYNKYNFLCYVDLFCIAHVPIPCIHGYYQCTSGDCILLQYVCDGAVDCKNDRSDEAFCGKCIWVCVCLFICLTGYSEIVLMVPGSNNVLKLSFEPFYPACLLVSLKIKEKQAWR